jgi:hypothetical protein
LGRGVDLAAAAAGAAPEVVGHWPARPNGTQTGEPQHVLTAHVWPDGQPFAESHAVRLLHKVEPGMHSPVLSGAVCTQTQSELVLLHGVNDPHVAPVHSGCGAGVVVVVGVTHWPAEQV